MAKAEVTDTLSVDREKLFQTITRYEDYPKFVSGVHRVEVTRKGPGHARVTYFVSMMGKEISYTLDHREDPIQGKVEWSLVESGFMKANNGLWELRAAGDGKTGVRYQLELELSFPVPGFILSGLVKKDLPSMVKSFEKQARS